MSKGKEAVNVYGRWHEEMATRRCGWALAEGNEREGAVRGWTDDVMDRHGYNGDDSVDIIFI
jgi:hypothetical protein